MSEVLNISGILDTFSRLKDGAAKIVFVTQELRPADWAILGMLAQSYGVMRYAPNGETIPDNLPDPPRTTDSRKSESRQLRDALFVYWSNNGEPMDEFETWYRHEMKRIRTHYLNKLED